MEGEELEGGGRKLEEEIGEKGEERVGRYSFVMILSKLRKK